MLYYLMRSGFIILGPYTGPKSIIGSLQLRRLDVEEAFVVQLEHGAGTRKERSFGL